MANPLDFLFGGAKVEQVSDLAAAEREVQSYLAGLAAQPKGPEAHFPFALDKQAAVAAFTKWIGGLMMAPAALKRMHDLGALKQVYVPFWAVNSMTYTTYKGERGDNHTETEHYTDAQGNRQTRNVTKTRWSPAAGVIRHHFDNLTVCAASNLPDAHVKVLTPKELKNLQKYQADAFKDIPVEALALDAKTGFNKARAVMDAEIRNLVNKDIGGSQQKVSKVETQHVGVALAHVLVPAWLGSYKFRDKEYKVVINGATGEVTGDYPLSAGKIILVVVGVLAVVAVIAGVIVYFVMNSGH
jgi:hypothetical protein